MRKWVIIIGLIIALLAGCLWLNRTPGKHEVARVADPDSRRATALGMVVGFADRENTHTWLGIPYAQPPVGNLRWRAPRPPKPWQGTYAATAFGSPCVQFGGPLIQIPKDLYGKAVGSEDCLYLNIYAPRFTPNVVPEGSDRLPVMVWIHGGGNSIGSASLYFLASNIAGKQKVIVVTINYRLGVFGWFYHPDLNGRDASADDRSGNYGTLDIIQALRWVQENISPFGGNPKNVTIFGESAGGANVYSLLVSPLAKGLFHRAIVQSGGFRTYSLAEAENFTDDPAQGHIASSSEILNHLLIADHLAKDRAQAKALQASMDPQKTAVYLRSKSPAELLAPFKYANFGMYSAPFIFRDGTVLPQKLTIELFTDASQYNSVPVILGSNRDEFKLFMAEDPRLTKKLFGLIPRIRDLDTYNRLSGYFSDAWKALAVDEPASAMRRAQGPSVYAYRFDWDEEPNHFLLKMRDLFGACHGLEVGFVFGDLKGEMDFLHIYNKKNYPGREQLSDAMLSYWTEFAYHGTPGCGRKGDLPEWKPWENNPGSSKFMILDTRSDGGIRMSSDAVTAQDIKARLIRDQSLIGSQEGLCFLYAKLFLYSFQSAHDWDEQEYNTFGKQGCRDYPPSLFR